MFDRFETRNSNQKNQRKNSVKLSIIIPIYNAEKFLKKCLESILSNEINQQIEIILLNDGSVDQSENICLEYLEKFPTVIKYKYKQNTGCSDTRNMGIFMAKGEYISFLDSDDFIDAENYFKLLTLIENEDIIVFGTKNISLNDKIDFKLNDKINLKSFIQETHLFASPVNKFYKRELLIKNKIKFPIKSHCGEDLAFNIKLYPYLKTIKFFKECPYIYILHGENSIYSIQKKKDIFNTFIDIIEFYNKNKLDLKEVQKKFRVYAIKYSFFMLENLRSEDFKKYRQIFRDESLKLNKKYFRTNKKINLEIFIYFYFSKILWKFKLSKTIFKIKKIINKF